MRSFAEGSMVDSVKGVTRNVVTLALVHPVVAYFVCLVAVAACAELVDTKWFWNDALRTAQFSSNPHYVPTAAIGLIVGMLFGGLTALIGKPMVAFLQAVAPEPAEPYISAIACAVGLACTFLVAFALSEPSVSTYLFE